MALLDQVKKSLTSGFQLPQFGQSESIKQLQRASAGREVVGGEGGPQQGSLAETVAAAAAKQQQQEDILQGQVAAAGLEQQEKEQEQQFQQKTAQLDEQALNVRQQMQNKTQEILQDFVQRRDELDFKANSSRVQYALASMRLSNDDYLDRLEAEGARSRLEDQTAFDWELTQTIMANEMEMFQNDLTFKAAMNADDRAFNEYIAEFNIDQAIKLATIETEAAETKAEYQAYGQLVEAAGSTLMQGAKQGWFSAAPESADTGTFGGQAPLESFRNKETVPQLNPELFNTSSPSNYVMQSSQSSGKLINNLSSPIQLAEID